MNNYLGWTGGKRIPREKDDDCLHIKGGEAMKAKEYTSKSALCPFYQCEVPQSLKCEGVEHGTALHVTFDSKGHKAGYKARFCCGQYRNCMLFRMLEDKYE